MSLLSQEIQLAMARSPQLLHSQQLNGACFLHQQQKLPLQAVSLVHMKRISSCGDHVAHRLSLLMAFST